MSRTALTPDPGLVLFQSPSRRQRMARRRVLFASAFLGLALVSAAIGAFNGREARAPSNTGAFSYFPAE